jgi:signal transduction histidine kinase
METTHVTRINQIRLEWALLGGIVLVCAGLSALQYRWTGEVSRAERARLLSGLNEQVVRLARDFHEEIRESLSALRPTPAELRAAGAPAAHQARFEQWAVAHDGAQFARIGVVVPEQAVAKLYELDRSGHMVPAAWPPAWLSLRDQIVARLRGSGPPPLAPLNSTLIEIPVFEDARPAAPARGSAHHGQMEIEWMILELSPDYVRNKMLPRLAAEYLNPGGEVGFDLSVSWSGQPDSIIYSTRADGASVAAHADLTAGLLPVNAIALAERQPLRFRDQQPVARWTLAVRHRGGSLDALVERARLRNLIAALVLVALLGGTAWLLVRHAARSRRLSDMQFRFVAGVSHDLRTPLTAIRGAAFNIANGLVTETAAVGRYGKLILRNAEDLTSMIENVLAYSATVHAHAEEPREAFAIDDLLEHAVASLAQECEPAGCRIELTVAPGLPAVAGNPVALDHAFRNLIGNAVRHAAAGKWIGVSAALCGEEVEIRICDRGPGIPEAELKRIFDPFFRGERSRAEQIRGTGLGLSLVKDTVERHHGTVTAANSPGGGLQVTVRLPVATEVV